MLAQEIIRRKRDGHALTDAEIAWLIEALTSDRLSEGQAAAFAMAVFFRGMDLAECAALTRAMTASGTAMKWDLPGPVLDKHSTGGVGDNVSLILSPAVAACGGFVPMISGRGLGHTGGTLDKLDSIPGYCTQPDNFLFRAVVAEIGCAIIGQTADLAPADRRLYAIRDVTATVESVPLITASILSKKLAAGLDALALDVKTGNGAFMATLDGARDLAERLVAVADQAGLRAAALLTNMDEPLASAAGAALEIRNAVDHLAGRRRDPRLHEVVVALGGRMLLLGALASSQAEGERLIESAIASGAAAERFARMVSALGGPNDLIARPERHLPVAPIMTAVFPAAPGRVRAIETRTVGVAVIGLGGGRRRAEDAIDPAVGFSDLAAIGDEVGPDRPLGVVHAREEARALAASAALQAAYRLGEAGAPRRPVILERIIAGASP